MLVLLVVLAKMRLLLHIEQQIATGQIAPQNTHVEQQEKHDRVHLTADRMRTFLWGRLQALVQNAGELVGASLTRLRRHKKRLCIAWRASLQQP